MNSMYVFLCRYTYIDTERQVVTREAIARCYPLSAYYVAKILSEVPVTVFLPAGFGSIVYPALRLQREVSPVPTALELAKQQFEEGCAVLMCILGVVCGVVSLAVLLSVKFDGSNGTNGVASG